MTSPVRCATHLRADLSVCCRVCPERRHAPVGSNPILPQWSENEDWVPGIGRKTFNSRRLDVDCQNLTRAGKLVGNPNVLECCRALL